MTRTCRTCGETKELELFTKPRHQCKACRSAYRRAYYQDNKEKVAAYLQDNKEKVAVQGRVYRQNNKEKITVKDRRYRQNNKEKKAALSATRRARKRGATIGDSKAMTAFFRHTREGSRLRFYWCSRVTAKHDRHVDHIVPLSKNGTHGVENLCVSCAHCNMSKGAKLPHEFSGQYEMELA